MLIPCAACVAALVEVVKELALLGYGWPYLRAIVHRLPRTWPEGAEVQGIVRAAAAVARAESAMLERGQEPRREGRRARHTTKGRCNGSGGAMATPRRGRQRGRRHRSSSGLPSSSPRRRARSPGYCECPSQKERKRRRPSAASVVAR